MSAESFLAFDGVWKRFRRGQVHDSLRDLLPAMVRKFSGKERADLDERDFWALKDISFDVRPGEVLGIIGPNGAGKSTTLKVLNQLMDPTKGEVRKHGKIGSLIEVSAGFHQDLTGRQNVFLQGAIMGMRKEEIKRKFDMIVDFSGISEFIDTPVKRYSSGMNARLGFSIAAHLEPDILIIDEVLAVGDHAFQQRAFGKIKSIATGGSPVVLVSHQLDRIVELCTKCILLNKGEIKTSGTAIHCVNRYLHPPESEILLRQLHDVGIQFSEFRSLSDAAIPSGEDLNLLLVGVSKRKTYPHAWQLALRVVNADSGAGMHSVMGEQRDIRLPVDTNFEHQIALQMNLTPGNYFVEIALWDNEKAEDMLLGPRIYVEVLERHKFNGPAQLRSRWENVSTKATS